MWYCYFIFYFLLFVLLSTIIFFITCFSRTCAHWHAAFSSREGRGQWYQNPKPFLWIMTKSRFLEGLWIGAMMAISLRNNAFPLSFAYPEPKPRASTTNLSMLQRIRLVKKLLDSTLVRWWKVVASATAVRGSPMSSRWYLSGQQDFQGLAVGEILEWRSSWRIFQLE